jgi:ribulose-5-phosphate 4-epimerase/fuculose-1-phosphate aldolase
MGIKLEDLRQELVALGIELVRQRLAHDGQGNMSLFDRERGLVAITPSAIGYREREAEDICLVDLDGNLIEGRWEPTTEMALHLIFYQRREDISAVVHTHAPYTSVFGVIGQTTMPMVLSEAAMALGGAINVAPYHRPGTMELADAAEGACRTAAGVILAQHGLVTVGSSLHLAYQATLAAEFTARTLIMARSMGADPLALDAAEVAELRRMYLGQYKARRRRS